MPTPSNKLKPKKKPMPILARHAVSLGVVFVLGLVLSYFAAQVIHQRIQLNKLSSTDQATFEKGLGYIVNHAGNSETITAQALDIVNTTTDLQRAADLLLAVAQSHANREDVAEPVIPNEVSGAIAPLMQKLEPIQAIGLYDSLITIPGINPIHTAEHLLQSLDPKDDAQLLHVADLLDTRIIWSKTWAPRDLWLGWLVVLSKSDSELTQFNAVKRLGDLPDSVDDPRVAQALTKLSASPHERIRSAVLPVAAGYAAIANDPTDYEQIIFNLGTDENKHIARRAWMIVGHLNPLSGFAVNWQDADPFVAEAMLWAAVKTNPENGRPVLESLRDPAYAPYAMQSLALAPDITFDEINTAPAYQHCLALAEDQSNLLTVWRTLLAIDAGKRTSDTWSIYLWSYLDKDAEPPAMFQLSLASIYRSAYLDLPGGFRWEDAQLAIGSLAAAEGQVLQATAVEPFDALQISPIAQLVVAATGAGSADLDTLIANLPLDQPVLLDLFTLALTHADEDTLDRYIRSAHPQMVTMAALASVTSEYEPKLIKGVNADFLRKHPDLTDDQLRAMTDSELAALGLSRIDALPALLDAAEGAPPSANREVEAKLLKLALWMRGDLGDDFTPTAEAMLDDADLPTSTVLMCLLHKQRPAALEYLFGTRSSQRPDLHKLFIQERYWHVFRRFVDTSDLTLWLWGDPEAQAFQLEAMRQWYAVNRWKIEQGWWPELIDD